MSERNILSKGDIVELINKREPTLKRTFEIVKKIDDGAFSICYEAFFGDSGHGVLKEFYPEKNNAFLERNKDNQLVISDINEYPDQVEDFEEGAQKYIEPYEKLITFYQDSGGSDLQKFIPPFEIYYGYSESENKYGTVYLWTNKYKLDETFDQICDEIHKYPNKNPERNLAKVLCAIYTLTKCILVLHQEGFVHRDIKPTNFGFVKLGDETLTQDISLFDINTICSLNQRNCSGSFFSEGFSEPELKRGEPVNNLTDIYSIGATLFYAIVVTEEIREPAVDENDEDFKKPFLYYDSYYDRLPALVKDSELIKASESNSYFKLVDCLTGILQKCLCERENRYEKCERLLDDLENAMHYISPQNLNFASKSSFRECWALIEKEKFFDQNKEKNSTLAIQYHLYEHPLYQCVHEDEEAINVLLIGFGNYSQKFLDACLQAGQMRNKHLCVTVVSDDVKNEKSKDNKEKGSDEIYLGNRPELKEFFNVDNSLKDRIDKKELELSDVYGDITFVNNQLNRNNEIDLRESIKQIMCVQIGDQSNPDSQQHPHYIFIALGEDALNQMVGEACLKTAEDSQLNTIINFVQECEPNKNSLSLDNSVFPLYINADIKESPLYAEIERMAFNTHLIWKRDLNFVWSDVKKEFREPYNHDSSVSCVLSMKYKLHSIGVDFGTSNVEDIAESVDRFLKDKRNRKTRDELIWIEHRRWVTEKLCLGWIKLDKLEDCLNGITKDDKNKRHICIVRSKPDQKLTDDIRKQQNFEMWDNLSDNDLKKYDELDQMSILLHQAFVQKANTLKNEQNLLEGHNMAQIRELISGSDKRIEIAFHEWYCCLKDIWYGDKDKASIYDWLKRAFLDSTEDLPQEVSKSIKNQVKAFESIFYPVLASADFRDWKQTDTDLIDNIPFILTYSENTYMVIPYRTGNISEIFKNVAAPTVINPSRIIYLYLIEKEKDFKDIIESASYIMRYMKKKNFRAKVEFVLLIAQEDNIAVESDFKENMYRIDGRIKQIKPITENKINELLAELKKFLKKRRMGKHIFAIEKNETKLSGLLEVKDFYDSFSNYKFNSQDIKFDDVIHCNMFGFIQKKPYISVTDMAEFDLSSNERFNQLEFFNDYVDFWEKYTENRNVWKWLCDDLKKHIEKNDVIASFKKKRDQEKFPREREYRYIIPSVCSKSVIRIIDFLKEHSIAEPKSCVNIYSVNSYEILIYDKCGYKEDYDKLFSNTYALMSDDALNVYLNTKSHCVVVEFDKLDIEKLQLVNNACKSDKIKLLKYFEKKGYIINFLENNNGEIAFTFATRQFKGLITKAGEILEVYTYHKAMEFGKFDDVVSSFEVDWENSGIKNEFDCILTKGFRTLIVECKARSDINQDFYYKLHSLAEKFINATPVLVADTQENADSRVVNEMERKRGDDLGVLTISGNEINNIGHTLWRVINGSYSQNNSNNR